MKKKSKKQLADESYLRVEAERVQVGMFEAPPKENPPLAEPSKGVPIECPKCKRRTQRPSTWTHMRWWQDESPILQCGQCGEIVAVTEEVWTEVRDDARVAFIDRSPNTQTRERRQQKRYDNY